MTASFQHFLESDSFKRILSNPELSVCYVGHISKPADEDFMYINGESDTYTTVRVLERLPGSAGINLRGIQ